MFSLIQTAIANDLDPYRYVVYLINELPEPTTLGFDYSKYLPWSDSIPDDIKMKKWRTISIPYPSSLFFLASYASTFLRLQIIADVLKNNPNDGILRLRVALS